MTMQKYVVGWLLIWVADLSLTAYAWGWEWFMLDIPDVYHGFRDGAVIVFVIGLVAIPIKAYGHLREVKHQLFLKQKVAVRTSWLRRVLPADMI